MKKGKLKKGKITVVITIAIACFALVTVMFMQFKVVNETDITSIGKKNIKKRMNNIKKKQPNFKNIKIKRNQIQKHPN